MIKFEDVSIGDQLITGPRVYNGKYTNGMKCGTGILNANSYYIVKFKHISSESFTIADYEYREWSSYTPDMFKTHVRDKVTKDFMMSLPNGTIVSCVIDGHEVPNACVAHYRGEIYLAQNVMSGANNSSLASLGYEYTWMMDSFSYDHLVEQVVVLEGDEDEVIISKGDEVFFEVDGERFRYVVSRNHLAHLDGNNDDIFNALGILDSKVFFCSKVYGYQAGHGNFPTWKKEDMNAASNIIKALNSLVLDKAIKPQPIEEFDVVPAIVVPNDILSVKAVKPYIPITIK